MVKKRVSRARKRQLETPDEFISFTSRLFDYVLKNKTYAILILGAVFLIIIVFAGMRHYYEKAESQAYWLLSQAMNRYHDDTKDKGAKRAFEDVKKDFEKIIQKYSGNDGGKFARFYFANICLEAENFEKAIDLFTDSEKDFDAEPAISNLILNGLGYSYEGMKDYRNAAKYFEMIASSQSSILKDQAYFNLGVIYSRIGNSQQSNEAFKKIIDNYPDSIYFELVTEKLAGKTAKTPLTDQS